MLINCVKEEGEERVKEKEVINVDENIKEYHAANELFEIMDKNHSHHFDVLENKSLTTRDLVILYENVDLGTKLMSNVNEVNYKAPNQYVETVIYNDDLDSEDSDVCEVYSNEDLHNVFSINNERIDLLSNIPSFENTLCHKFGNVRMKTSDFSNEYKRHFLFNDPYIKEQLQSFHAMTDSKQSDSAVLPTSLLDYICCKRLEDNYNFYMDNIITYVQNTIEQLKRISNGDYLTDRVKEKWRGGENVFVNKTNENDKIIALSSTHNNPLPIVGKTEVKNTWDEVVHSEIDVRSLSKILEKKIILEVPKLLCGSFGLFTKGFRDNINISCKKGKKQATHDLKKESSMDVLLKLQRSEIEHMNHNVNTVVVLKTLAPSITRKESCENNVFALQLKEVGYNKEEKVKIIELGDNDITHENVTPENTMYINEETKQETSLFSGKIYETDTSFDLVPSDKLGYAIHRLNIQSSVLEENEDCASKKKKSPTRVRIKSPYENKSYILDERKRKRLLEIRAKREKKKLAMNEKCKITKHKYVKGAVTAQSSNSVTKLSITNKSFYNSIYGQTNIANDNIRNVIKEPKEDDIPGIDIQEHEEEFRKEPSTTSPGKSVQKYINRSYYLDDADTEIMYLQMKPNNNEDDINEILTSSVSVLSTDVGGNVTCLKNLINTSTTDLSGTDTTSSFQQNILLEDSTGNANNFHIATQNTEITVPSNTPKEENNNRNDKYKKMIKSVECRKNIDKIYDLMKTMTLSPMTVDNKARKIENTNNFTEKDLTGVGNENIAMRESESGTSAKLKLSSSNPSTFGFEKRSPVIEKFSKFATKKTETSTTVVPKVVISSKFQAEKRDGYKKKENKKADSKIADNPLKAISQLLHEFDNVQKTRYKNGKETKSYKKTDITVEDNSAKHLALKNAFREVKNIKHTEQESSRFFKPLSPTKILKFSQQNPKGDKPIHKNKLTDIIDEVKEMRGEAVRGPSKRSSRIDNLAQPKKSYVQAHHEDFQNRYHRNVIPRGQKLTMTSLSIQEKNIKPNFKNRQRIGTEISSAVAKQSNKIGPSLEKTVKPKRSANSSPVEKEKRLPLSANKLPQNINNEPDSLEDKMVAVETYLKNHFGQVSPVYKVNDKNIHKSRVPLVPTDIDIASMTSSPLAEESTTLGIKLHNMVKSKITTNMEMDERLESVEHSSKCGATISTSDHPVDIFEDKNIITAVACISKEDNNSKIDKDCNVDVKGHKAQELKSCHELQKLENAIYRQMSNGTFQKRLRIKNLTLTPKQSMQQVFVLQSGDAKPLIVKSTLSQKSGFSKTDIVPKLNILPVMSRNAIKFNLPMQIATVGYVFPTYQTFKNNSNNEKNSLDSKDFANNLHVTSKNNGWVDKTVQCYKGSNERQSLKQNTDAISTDLFNVNTVCSKEISDMPKETIVRQELKTPSIQEKIISTNTDKDIYESENIKTKNSDNISDSTSLDILVRLLNEIKKITTCPSNLDTSVNEMDTRLESKELKVILNNSAARDNSADHSVQNSISISSLDNKPHMYPSNFSLHLQSNIEDYVGKFKIDNNINNTINYDQPLFSDKQINVQIAQKDFVHRFTDVPSRFFPITVNRSTDVVRSLIALVNKTSNESESSFSDCHILYSNSTFNGIRTFTRIHKRQSLVSSKSKDNKLQENNTKNVYNVPYVCIKPKNNILEKNKINGRNFDTLQEFDPLMKMKRDVLVTVYSILVLTVFAALTIPEKYISCVIL